MAEINLLLKLRNALGVVINPRKEDGHGSAVGTPTHVSVTNLATGLSTEATLAALNSKDFATQTTLAALKARADLLVADATAQLRDNAFATLLHYLPRSIGDEMRRVAVGTDVYHLRAPDGTATSSATWEAVRFYQDAAETILRTRYRTGVSADNPSVGWT